MEWISHGGKDKDAILLDTWRDWAGQGLQPYEEREERTDEDEVNDKTEAEVQRRAEFSTVRAANSWTLRLGVMAQGDTMVYHSHFELFLGRNRKVFQGVNRSLMQKVFPNWARRWRRFLYPNQNRQMQDAALREAVASKSQWRISQRLGAMRSIDETNQDIVSVSFDVFHRQQADVGTIQ